MKVLVLLAGLLLATTAFGTTSPFGPDADARFKVIENMTGDVTLSSGVSAIGAGKVTEAMSAVQTGSAEGLFEKKIARAHYDVATDLGTIAAHGLGVTLPAHAIITRSWFEIKTQFVDAGAGTVAISCEDANNIKTATDITGSAVGAIVEGQSTGAASAFTTSIAAACEITATVAGAAQTAGYLTVFVEYVVGE